VGALSTSREMYAVDDVTMAIKIYVLHQQLIAPP